MKKFTPNNQPIGELYEKLSPLVKKITLEEWDEDIFYAIKQGLPLKPVIFIKKIQLTSVLGKTNYEIIDGMQMLETIFSYLDSKQFEESEAANKEHFWSYIISTIEINEDITEQEKSLIKKIANKF